MLFVKVKIRCRLRRLTSIRTHNKLWSVLQGEVDPLKDFIKFLGKGYFVLQDPAFQHAAW
jgi:hypothetical protein